MKSSSPCLTSARWISSRRCSTRRRIKPGPAGAVRCAHSRASIRSTASRTAVDAVQEFLELGLLTRSRLSSCRYSAMFSPAVRRARRAHAQGPLREQRQAARGQVADDARQFFFEIRPREREQLPIRVRYLGVAADSRARRRASAAGFAPPRPPASCQLQQCERRSLDGRVDALGGHAFAGALGGDEREPPAPSRWRESGSSPRRRHAARCHPGGARAPPPPPTRRCRD